MNPFLLPGPEFLLLYLVLGIAVLGGAWMQVRAAEDAAPPPLPLSDPYQIAWLRGGTPEAARIAVLSLYDRGLIELDGDRLRPGERRLLRREAYPALERAVIECAANSAPATAVWDDLAVNRACEGFRARAESMGLVPDQAVRLRRLKWYGGAGAIAFAIGLIKFSVAAAEHRHNIGGLLLLMAASVVVPVLLGIRRRTSLGDRIVADLRTLFAPQQARAGSLRPGGMTSDAVLLASVLGLGALPAAGYAPLQQTYKKASSSGGGCGGGCGSGCGGGGGGCGGCGSG